ncbi:MAG: PAS domain S-box protein [Deltaproteobacteria bacterium]|nr:PAS domain S-box protein [Deltaproteobacteria bacterium]
MEARPELAGHGKCHDVSSDFVRLVDVDRHQRLLDSFCDAVGIAAAIIDLQGRVIVGSRWQRICTDFHRVDKRTFAKCIESDTQLSNALQKGKTFSLYQCKNGLTDAASPIIIEGQHVANAFVGQFLLEPPDLDFFYRQAQKYGFEQKAYLEALAKVPIVDRKKLPMILNFLTTFAESVAMTVTDRLKRLEAGKALSKKERKYQHLIETTSEGYWLIDHEQKTVEVNESLCRMLGYRPDEMIGKSPLDFVDEEGRKVFESQMGKIRDTLHRSYEIILKKKTGEDLYTHVNATTVFDESGAIEGSFALITDITERRQQEANRVLLATAIDHIREAVVITDHEANILYANPAFEHITGYPTHEVVGRNPRFLKSGRHDQAFYQELWDTLKRGEVWNGHFTNKKKDGTLYEEEACISPVRSPDGTITHFVAVKRDVTDLVAMERQLRQSQKMEAIGTLAGGIAHDFNNILTPMIIQTELALSSVSEDSPLRPGLQEVLKASHRAKDLVKQILTFSRQKETKRVPLTITPIIKEALKLLRYSLPATIEIQERFKAEVGMVLADPIHIHQILMNLCANAAYAMREKGGVLGVSVDEVELDADSAHPHPGLKPGRYVRLCVSDTGCGIDPVIAGRILDPFFTTKNRSEGTGMGLSVVHGIVKSYGGTLKFDSVLGQGTTFQVLFPGGAVARPRQSEAAFQIPAGQGHVLFVDDEKATVDSVGLMLKRLGYQVTVRTSSIEALEAFRAQPDGFDLVITDQTMPNMRGDELAQELMRIRPDIPVILCTGFSEAVLEEKTKALGIRELVIKPITTDDMARTIQKVLGDAEPEKHGSPSIAHNGAK